MRKIIVSAADPAYFPSLQSLVRSIRERPESAGFDVAVLDLGLEPKHHAWLATQEVEAVVPRHSVHPDEGLRDRAFSARPFLPECLPGHDLYLWIDADAWVQDWSAIDLYVGAAKSGALAIVCSIDRGYDEVIPTLKLRSCFGFVYGLRGWAVDHFHRSYGRRTALRLALKPYINGGVFALRANAPQWRIWQDGYRRAWGCQGQFGFDQIALTYAIFELGLEVELLPAWCNWICSRGLPKFDPASASLVEPYLPHRRLGIVHLVHRKHEMEAELALVGGGTTRRTLGYCPLE
jgi:hypothetical protein